MINHCKAALGDLRYYFGKWSGWILFTAILLYYELLFHELNFGIGDGNIVQIIIFALVGGGVCGIITNVFPVIVDKIIATVLTLFIGILFVAQYIYHSVFNNYLSVMGTIRFGNQAADNADTVISNMKAQISDIILMVIPVIIAIILIWTIMAFDRRRWWTNLIGTGIVAVVYIATIMVMWAVDSDVYSPYKIYSQYTSVDLAVEKLGVMESFVVDVRASVTSGSDKGQISFASAGMDSVVDPLEGGKTSENIPDASDTKEPNTYKNVDEDTDTSGDKSVSTTEATTEVPVDTSPNMLDLDFEAINELSGSDAVASLSEYFENVTPTKKNEYTGMFEGYNVIWITAEGFTGYALESGLFPTLSKLADEGFVFDSYYQPLWYGSTLGGEYANLMGSPTKNGAYLSMCRAADNENGMYFSLANTLKRMGYSCYGFHDNDYTYYDRNITHPALGYEWIASGNGLEYQTDEYGQDMWPQSDLVMMEETFDKYTNDQPFHLYYLTVSGHVPYGYGAANAMSEKNKDVVSDLNYSDTTKAYLASQYEMEKMLEGIVERLEKRNLLDKTVIVLAGDHVPYDNMEVVDELAGQEFGYSLDAYRSRLVIWSGSMEKPVRVNKVCSSIDILPTLLNLMGAEYDSRLIIGRDILLDSAGLVLFPDRSYVTDTYEYNAALGTIVGDVSDETFDAMQLYVADKFTAADNITETGYYSYVAEYLGK